MRTRSAGRMPSICLVLSFACWSAWGTASAEGDPLAGLNELFRKDPASAFEESWRLFQEPMGRGDLDGMMAIVRVVKPEAIRCLYGRALDAMLDAVIPAARDSGKWEILGEAFEARADLNLQLRLRVASWDYMALGMHRFDHCLLQALEAYARAGKIPDALKDDVIVTGVRDSQAAFDRNQPGEAWYPAYRAYVDGDHAQAVRLGLELLAKARDDPWGVARYEAMRAAAPLVEVPGGEAVLQAERALWDPSPDTVGDGQALAFLCAYCTRAWSGRDDVYRDCFYWILGQFDPLVFGPWNDPLFFALKLAVFGRKAEGLSIARRWFDFVQRVPPGRAWGYADLPADMPAWYPDLPPDLLQQFAELPCRVALEQDRIKGIDHPEQVLERLGELVSSLPAERRGAMAAQLGLAAASTAVTLRDLPNRANGLEVAAKVFDTGGYQAEAQQVRAMAALLRQGDPQAILQTAIAAAGHAAAQERWEDVVSTLEPVASGDAPSLLATDALVLLVQAQRKLGKPQEADALLARAEAMAGGLNAQPQAKADSLLSLARLTEDRARKLDLLERARQAAREAGLQITQQRIAEQLAQAAMDAGDLDAAEKALTDIVNASEVQRGQLAFDPLLRQQWFADHLSAYRRLLKVAALKGNAHLALTCAEGMRARALIDQLAWRKVDMEIGASPEMREQLSALRKQRHEVYSLLRQATGGGVDPEVDLLTSRGVYMPTRGTGLFLPTMGPTGAAPPVDAVELRRRLDQLAHDESACQAAVREYVPAYGFVDRLRILPSEEVAKAVGEVRGLAALEYTLCEGGIVVVALQAKVAPKVALIQVSADDLKSRIHKAREAIRNRTAATYVETGALYDLLIAPVEECLRGATRLWIAADGALQLIPFGALADPNGRGLVETVAPAYVPSLSMAFADRGARGQPRLPALVVAAPSTGVVEPAADTPRDSYSATGDAYLPTRGEDGISLALTSMAWAPLPGAKAEGETVARQLTGSVLLTGGEATRPRLLEQGASCGVLHIATHGYADPEVPEFSGLLLSKEGDPPYDVLTAEDVLAWTTCARLVTLSACQTGLGKTMEGEGLLGLPRAFICAGAQDVLCSLWSVADESTAELMKAFYVELGKGAAVEEALRQAQLELLTSENWKHPYYWAGFVPVRGPK